MTVSNTPIPPQPGAIPIIASSPTSGIFFHNSSLVVTPARLRNNPRTSDPRLSVNDPNQSFIDCRTIEGWMKFVTDLLGKAWDTGTAENNTIFTHDYGLLPEDPKNLKGTIIVWEILSKVPAMVGKDGTREIKPRVREIKHNLTTPVSVTPTSVVTTPVAAGQGSQWVWGQSFDVVMMFTIYGDTWGRMYEDLSRFEDFMTTYAGIFIQTGLQQLWYREQTRDALYDPPKTQAFPNKSVFYNARIEKTTTVDIAVVEQVLIKVGLINSATGQINDDAIFLAEAGIPESPILPSTAP